MAANFLSSIIAWLRTGYPDGLPQNDYVPLLALLSRRLTHEEIEQVISQSTVDGRPVEKLDIQVMITRITDELPREEDVNRVQARLAEAGWPLSGFDDDDDED